jgi:hypothetical protein
MNKLKQYFKVFIWWLAGCPIPLPHLIKQKMILDAVREY